eukprot:6469435-Amphidinium_carterae.1
MTCARVKSWRACCGQAATCQARKRFFDTVYSSHLRHIVLDRIDYIDRNPARVAAARKERSRSNIANKMTTIRKKRTQSDPS